VPGTSSRGVNPDGAYSAEGLRLGQEQVQFPVWPSWFSLNEMGPSDLELVAEHPGSVRLYAYRNVDVVLWESTPTFEALEAIDLIGRAVRRRLSLKSRKLSSLVVMADTVKPAPPSVAPALKREFVAYTAAVGSVVLVLEQRGFWGSIVRSAFSGLASRCMSADRFQIVPSLADAVLVFSQMHARSTGELISGLDLIHRVQNARRERPAPLHSMECGPMLDSEVPEIIAS